jgi:hypothetical protein
MSVKERLNIMLSRVKKDTNLMEEDAPVRKHVYRPHYFRRVGACLTQSLNTIFFWGSNPCESLSARSWRKRDTRWFGFLRHVIDAWFHVLGYPNHCERAATDDYVRALAYVEEQYAHVYKSLNKETDEETSI